jgi:cytochrome c oxidase assembly factor CtaG
MAHPWAGSPPGAPDATGSLASLLQGGGWYLAPEVVGPLALAGAAYAIGWARLTARSRRPCRPWPAVAALVALSSVAVALLSPLDAAAQTSFVAHMLQHMLLIGVAAPALLLADPLPVVLWALPAPARHGIGRLLGARGPLRGALRGLTGMPAAAVVYAAVLWGWHYPPAYDAALADPLLHHLEHLTFFAAALVFWWPVIAPAPRVRRPASPEARIAYVLLGAIQGTVLGLLLTLSPTVWYRTYAAAAPSAGLIALDDQALGGVVMWAVGGLVDMLAVGLLLWSYLAASEHRPAGDPVRQSP